VSELSTELRLELERETVAAGSLMAVSGFMSNFLEREVLSPDRGRDALYGGGRGTHRIDHAK
jgi:hypothetical protein